MRPCEAGLVMSIKQLIDWQNEVDEELQEIEQRIYDVESIMYEDCPMGNLIRGWDGFLDSKSKASQLRRSQIGPEERFFSNSSVTAPSYEDFVAASYGGGAMAGAGPVDDQLSAYHDGKRARSSKRARKRKRTYRSEWEDEDFEE